MGCMSGRLLKYWYEGFGLLMSQKLLLKVLNGLQSGAEVALDSGEYAIGSGPADDLQLRDISLKTGHARLRIGSEGAEIRAEAGDILLPGGGRLEAGDDRWIRLEPLAVLVLGTTRLSIGPPEANWASITEDEEFRRSAQPGIRGNGPAVSEQPDPAEPSQEASALEKRLTESGFPAGASAVRMGIAAWNRHPRIAAASASALVALTVSFLLLGTPIDGASEAVRRDPQADRIAVERAVASLPFPHKVRVRQEVDGQIIVKGIIRDAAERRALIGALEATRAPFRPRLATSEAIMAETRNLLGAYAARVRFVLREDGVLALNGLIVDPNAAARIVELLRNQLSGPTDIDATRLKTGADLVFEVTRMAREEGIGPNVMFTLTRNEFIEATGAVPSNQVNAWVSVLINYGDMFSDKLPLRSLVQLVATGDAVRPSEALDRPIIVGQAGPAGEADGRVLDIQRLRSGRFSPSEIFAQEKTPGTFPQPLQSGDGRIADRRPPWSGTTDERSPSGARGPVRPLSSDSTSNGADFGRDQLRSVEKWASGGSPASDQERRLFARLDETIGKAPTQGARAQDRPKDRDPAVGSGGRPLGADAGDAVARQSETGRSAARSVASENAGGPAGAGSEVGARPGENPTSAEPAVKSFLVARMTGERPLDRCRDPQPAEVPLLFKSLLWLDLLSTVDGLSIKALDNEMQLFLAEVMVNPNRAKECLARMPNNAVTDRVSASIFLGEALANPDFVAYVARDVLSSRLRLTGARTEMDNRYVVDTSGRFLRDGTSIDLQSRIWSIGETGVVIERAGGAEVLLYDRGLAWISRSLYETGPVRSADRSGRE